MENIKRKNILLRLWERLGQADIDDNEYEGVDPEIAAELRKEPAALAMLSSNSGSKKSSSAKKDENTKSINPERIQTRRVQRSRDDGYEIGE